jgi:transketolase
LYDVAPPSEAGQGKSFPIGGSKTLRSTDADVATVVAAGITVHEALAAADSLAADGIVIRVIDAYSVKPIDAVTLRQALQETHLIVTVEDHRPEGGLGDAVLDALAATGPIDGTVIKLAVTGMPGSGSPTELRAWAGIDSASIVRAVRGGLG